METHGLFEDYLLMALGSALLPPEGDREAAVRGVRADLSERIDDLPSKSVSKNSKAALRAMVAELPNPSGTLALSLRADPGIGPARVAGYAVTGVPELPADLWPLFQGVTLDVVWTHADAN